MASNEMTVDLETGEVTDITGPDFIEPGAEVVPITQGETKLSLAPEPIAVKSGPTIPAVNHPSNRPIPNFQGKQVGLMKVKVGSTLNMPFDRVLKLDDVVNLNVVARVVGINHTVSEKGELVRVQTVKVIEVEVVPFADGSDGVLEAK